MRSVLHWPFKELEKGEQFLAAILRRLRTTLGQRGVQGEGGAALFVDDPVEVTWSEPRS